MKRFIITGIYMALLSIVANAADKDNNYEYFKRGISLSVDFSAGAAFNGRIADRGRNPSYGTDVAVGYRFCPQLVAALGVGAQAYSNRTLTCNGTVLRQVENTCVPVFVRLRSDFKDREVSPYVQMDVGYTFMEMYSREGYSRVRYAEHPFSNGRYEYVDMDNDYVQYGNKGLFGSLDLGISLHVIGRLRMNVALSAGIHQAFFGTSFLVDGEVLDFGKTGYVAEPDTDIPSPVRIVGNSDFLESLEPFARVKIGFSF